MSRIRTASARKRSMHGACFIDHLAVYKAMVRQQEPHNHQSAIFAGVQHGWGAIEGILAQLAQDADQITEGLTGQRGLCAWINAARLIRC